MPINCATAAARSLSVFNSSETDFKIHGRNLADKKQEENDEET